MTIEQYNALITKTQNEELDAGIDHADHYLKAERIKAECDEEALNHPE